jgi:hypothetical protein
MNHRSNRSQRAYAILVEDILEDINYAKQVAEEMGLNIKQHVKADLERIEQIRITALNRQQAAYSVDINIVPKNNCVSVVLAKPSILFNLSAYSYSRGDEQGDEGDIAISEQDNRLHEGVEMN